MASKISICQVAGYYGYGGISRFVADLSMSLSEEFDVTFVCREVVSKPEDIIKLIELKPRNTFDFWRKLRNLREDFDIIHCHDVYALAGLVDKERKSRLIYTDHGIVPLRYNALKDIPGTIFAYACAMYALRKLDIGVGISDFVVSEMNRKKCPNVVKIPDAIFLDKFKIPNRTTAYMKDIDNLKLLRVGLLEKQKGVEFLILSMTKIIKEFPNAHLTLIGIGRDEKFLKEYAYKKGVNDKITFSGFVKDLRSYYNNSDIVIIPSYWESFGLPILEAMACGKPVISRDAYAMREHIRNSGGGVLFREDEPEELVKAIREVLNDYEKYSSNALKYSENFELSRIASEYSKIYVNVLGGDCY